MTRRLPKRSRKVGLITVPALGLPHQSYQSMWTNALAPGARTWTSVAPTPLIRFWRTGIWMPCQEMVTRGRVRGSEHVASLVFVSIAAPSMVPVAPLRLAVAENCDDRQSGGAALGEPPVVAR